MARPPKQLYYAAVVRTARGGRQLHEFHGTGEGFPTSLCGDAQAMPGSPLTLAQPCRECRLVAISEIALALDSLGFTAEAVAVAGLIHSASFETGAAMAG